MYRSVRIAASFSISCGRRQSSLSLPFTFCGRFSVLRHLLASFSCWSFCRLILQFWQRSFETFRSACEEKKHSYCRNFGLALFVIFCVVCSGSRVSIMLCIDTFTHVTLMALSETEIFGCRTLILFFTFSETELLVMTVECRFANY